MQLHQVTRVSKMELFLNVEDKMTKSDVKRLVAERLGWSTTDIFYLFYLTTAKDQPLDYYIVSKKHTIEAIAVIDSLNRRVVNIWK